MVIAGFDPGSKKYGVGLIAERNGYYEYIGSKTISINSEKREQLFWIIWEALREFYSLFQFDEAALEEGFLGKNVYSFGLLEQIRGLTIGFLIAHQIPFALYQPRMVKKSVCGYGNASKEQVRNVLPRFVKKINLNLSDDESDALAIALVHLFQKK